MRLNFMRAQRRRTLTSEVPVVSGTDLCDNEPQSTLTDKPKRAPKKRARGVKTNAKKNG